MTGYLNSLASDLCLLPRYETCLERAGLLLALWGSEKGVAQWFRPQEMPGLMWPPNRHSGYWLWVGRGESGMGGMRGAGGRGSKSAEVKASQIQWILYWCGWKRKGRMWGRGGNRPPQAQKN